MNAPTIAVASDFTAQRAAFLESLRVRRCAPATLTTRGQSLAVFGAFLMETEVADVREITREYLTAYQRWLIARGYADHTRRVHVAGLRAFFAHLERTAAMLVNPCAGVVPPRLARRLPRGVLTREQARRVLDIPNPRTPAGRRNKAILEVFYSTGLRLSELARLKVFDVDLQDGFVRVNQGKGGKDRIVPLGATACACVREYVAGARLEWSKENPNDCALWLGAIAPHRTLKAQAIQVMVRHYGRAAGLRVTPHLWRHTCATHLVSNGANLAAVQRLLGHASLETTQLYTHVAIAEVKATHRQCHPRA